MIKIKLIQILLMVSIVAFGQINTTATYVAEIPVGVEESDVSWYRCNIPIFIDTTKNHERITINSKQVIGLVNYLRTDNNNGIQSDWYIGKDQVEGTCRVMIQFLNANKIAIAVLYDNISYKYITSLTN